MATPSNDDGYIDGFATPPADAMFFDDSLPKPLSDSPSLPCSTDVDNRNDDIGYESCFPANGTCDNQRLESGQAVVLSASQLSSGLEPMVCGTRKMPTRNSAIIFSLEALPMMPPTEREYSAALAKLGLNEQKPETFLDSDNGLFFKSVFKESIEHRHPPRAKGWRASANAVAPDDENSINRGSQYKERYLNSAEAMFQSARMLIRSYGARKKEVLEAGDETGLLLFYDIQGDGASKKMRVTDESSVSATAELLPICDDATATMPGTTSGNCKRKRPSILIDCKIQYSEVGANYVTRKNSTGEIIHHRFSIPCGLQQFDRNTAEVLSVAQQTLYDVGLTEQLESNTLHVGVCAAQDKAGSNERQVNNAQNFESKKKLHGGKEHFRIPTVCEIHGIARCITTQHGFCQWLISGLIAWAIEEKKGDRLPQLRKIVGARLREIARVLRTSKHHQYMPTTSL